MAQFTIAGFTFTLKLPWPWLEAELVADWADFVSSSPSDMLIEVHSREGCSKGDDAFVTFWPKLSTCNEGEIRIDDGIFSAQLSANRSRMVIHQGADRHTLEKFVKVALADFLSRKHGLLVHSVAVAYRGAALLCTGPSGAGKSTLAALCRAGGLDVLADELSAVVLQTNGDARVIGTPWNVGMAKEENLSGLGLLAFCSEFRWSAVSTGKFIRILLNNIVMPDPSPSGRHLLFEVASRLVKTISTGELGFSRDPHTAPALKGWFNTFEER